MKSVANPLLSFCFDLVEFNFPLNLLKNSVKQLPESFIVQMQADLGTELPEFIDSLAQKPPVSIRINPSKNASKLLNVPISAPIAWHTEGYYLSERPSFTLDPAFHAGAYYVQEASSMFIAKALKQVIDFQDVTVLDLCAAPGGKSTLLASLLRGDSLLLANEVIKSRVEILKENLMKWGYSNVLASHHDSDDFADLQGFFDIVLVDAPCSGEGLFRKDEKAMDEWSTDSVQSCSARQKRILSNAIKLVKPHGILLYSTCTYNDFENKNNVVFIANHSDFDSIQLTNIEAGIVEKEWANEDRKKVYGYQFYPHRIQGEGFFVSVFKNTQTTHKALPTPKLTLDKVSKKQVEAASKWLKSPEQFEFFQKHTGDIFIISKNNLMRIALIDKALKKKSLGLVIGLFKGQDFIPSHDLALSIDISDAVQFVDLNKDDALKYLRKENFELPHEAPSGWTLARYGSLNLGWMKVLKNRINNYLPTEFRIRMK